MASRWRPCRRPRRRSRRSTKLNPQLLAAMITTATLRGSVTVRRIFQSYLQRGGDLEMASPKDSEVTFGRRSGSQTKMPAMTPRPAPSQPSPLSSRSKKSFLGGRMNRKAYWAALLGTYGALIILTLVFHFHNPATAGLTVWIFTRRLHDFGRSGWWQVGFYAITVVIVLVAVWPLLKPLGAVQSRADLVGVGLLAQITFDIVLGSIPGQSGPNRFGPAPGALSAEAQAEVFS
jgi:uncharacterized membrane protein YhaH (DUF805 family)